MAVVNPISVDVSVLYNSNFSYISFLSPGFIFVQFQMTVMLSALLIFVREFERKTIDSALTIVRITVSCLYLENLSLFFLSTALWLFLFFV
jgi:ABC-type multidrug transport system permease subunit